MAETEERPTLCFAASLPLEAEFAPTAGELANRLAVFAGVGEDDASAMGRSVEAAFAKAMYGPGVEGEPAIDVSLCAGETTLDVSVSCGSTTVLAICHPRPR